MPQRPLQWARQSVEGRQVEADGSRLINFYAVRPARAVPQEAKVPVMLYGSPGYRRWAHVPPVPFDQAGTLITPDAGIYGLIGVDTPQVGKRLFGVSSQYQLFEIREGAMADDLAPGYDPFAEGAPLYRTPAARIHNFTVEDSERAEGPVELVSDGRYILQVLKRDVRVWDIAAGQYINVPAPVADNANRTLPDEEWVSAAWVDNYFFLAARGGQIFNSGVGTITFDQLDFASAETKPDGIVVIKAFWGRVYVFGTASIERWYHRGSTDIAYQREHGYRTEVGCLTKHAVQTTEDEILFVGADFSVYSIAGDGTPKKVSSATVAFDIKRADRDNCWAYTYTEEDIRFYALTLPFHDGSYRTWVLDLETRLWAERTQTNILVCTRFDGRNLIGRTGSPYVHALDLDFGDADGVAIARTAIAPSLHANRRRVRVHRVDIEVPLRAGGQADDSLELSWSDDGQRTWESAGAIALDEGLLRWNRLGQFELGRHFRIETSAMRRVDLLGAYAQTAVDLP